MGSERSVNIGKQFSRFPAGRYAKDGPASGEGFRENVLIPLLTPVPNVLIVELDDAIGYGSSFLEEAFGGLVRRGFEPAVILEVLDLRTDDLSLKDEIEAYIKDAGRKGG